MNQSGANGNSNAESGSGFKPLNDITYRKKMIDLTDPWQVLKLAMVCGAAFWAWKKFK